MLYCACALRGRNGSRDGAVPHVGWPRPGVDHVGTRRCPRRAHLLRETIADAYAPSTPCRFVTSRASRVDAVGEILVKFTGTPTATLSTSSGGLCWRKLPRPHAVLPGTVATAAWDKENLGIDGKRQHHADRLWALSTKPTCTARSRPRTAQFGAHRPIEEVIGHSPGHRAWAARLARYSLTAEMVDMIERLPGASSAPSPSRCVQPSSAGHVPALRARCPG